MRKKVKCQKFNLQKVDRACCLLASSPSGPAFTNVPMTATDTSTVVLGDTAYTHDPNGNLTSDATFTYQYDLANQLTNVIRKAKHQGTGP